MCRNLTLLHVRVYLALARLPPLGPEPCLVGRNRKVRMELDHTVLTLDDLDLRARLIQAMTAPDVSR